MTNRRDFIKQIGALGVAGSMGSLAYSQQMISPENVNKMIWGGLLHLSTNMWEDHSNITWPGVSHEVYKDDFICKTTTDALVWGMRAYRPYLVFDDSVWNSILISMSNAGMNMVIIDLGDGVKYESHPEIAVKNAWSVDKLKAELAKIRKLGLEPIPKLNFATSHDIWLGEYSRMVSTKKYYEVCKNLISEVIELFDTPRFFHIGMDEEDFHNQAQYKYAVVRQHNLWWEDLYYYIEQIESKSVRPWIWSDYGWTYPEHFFKKMPKSVLQSNWYYGKEFGPNSSKSVQFYNDLETHGYDQIPTGSNWDNDTNMEYTVKYGKENIDPSRLFGFMTAPWFPTIEVCRDKYKEAITQIMNAKEKFYK